MSNRYFGGIVRKTPLVLDPALGNAAEGIFTMEQYLQAVKAGTWPAYDPYFEYTTLLLHGNGTNGAQNNTFLDSSDNNFTITRNGNTTQGTFSPFSKVDGRWGNFFDGSGDRLGISNNAAFRFGANPFTIEFFVYLNSTSGSPNFIACYDNSSTGYTIALNASAKLIVNLSGDVADITGSTTILTNTWYHVAVSGTGGTSVKLFLNGVQEGSTYTGATSLSPSNYELSIGAFFGGGFGTSNVVNGYMSNVRFVNGTALYTGNFTPPTAPLTAITNTSLLTCQSNRFVDNSTNNFTITRNGDVKVTPLSPFPITTAYDPAVNGGSGYFDGSGDYLTVPNTAALQIGTADFEIEGWFYVNSLAATVIIDARSGATATAYTVGFDASGNPYIYNGASTFTGSSGIRAGQWNNVVWTRASGTLYMFVNGVSVYSAVNSTSMTGAGTNLTLCAIVGGGSQLLNGYLSGLKIINGTGVSSVTVPTSPASTVGSALYLGFTNAGIFDNTGFNNLETAGNAQIDTAVKKFGSGALEFDGTGDWLTSFNGAATYSLGTIYTVEMWFYTNSVAAGNAGLINLATTSGGNTGFNLYRSSAEILCNNGATAGTGPSSGVSSISVSTWTHLAVTSDGTSTRIFLDGVLKNTYTGTTGSASVLLYATIGAFNDKTAPFNGYIDDLRITKGIARYTSNFTPQTSQWQDQ